jgi:hypothetical protein
VIVLVGVAGFVLSCFLPYSSFGGANGSSRSTTSYYEWFTFNREALLQYVGVLLFLFGGAATIAWVAFTGLRHGQHERRRMPSALTAVTVAWSSVWLGLLGSVVSGGFLGAGYEVGYWSMLVSVCVVIARSSFGSLRDTPRRMRTQPLAPNRRRRFQSARPKAPRAARAPRPPPRLDPYPVHDPGGFTVGQTHRLQGKGITVRLGVVQPTESVTKRAKRALVRTFFKDPPSVGPRRLLAGRTRQHVQPDLPTQLIRPDAPVAPLAHRPAFYLPTNHEPEPGGKPCWNMRTE